MPRLQKAVSAAISRERKRIFMLSCGDEVSTRISSCALPGASDWLNDVRSAMDMSDFDVLVAVRLRLGLPLSELVPPSCPLCDEDMRDHPSHPLGCVKLRRGGILKRHDSCQNGLARFARSNLCLVHVTPKSLRGFFQSTGFRYRICG